MSQHNNKIAIRLGFADSDFCQFLSGWKAHLIHSPQLTAQWTAGRQLIIRTGAGHYRVPLYLYPTALGCMPALGSQLHGSSKG
jgi:hypothetical protein